MYRQKKREIWASDVAEYLNAKLVGNDFLLDGPRAIEVVEAGALRPTATAEQRLLLTNGSAVAQEHQCRIVVDDPTLSLARILIEFFASSEPPSIHPSAHVSPEAVLGRNVHVGANAVIGPDVQIGDETRVMNNAVIHGPATIGKACVVKDGAVIGSEGYRFVRDEDGRLVHLPQLGRILIGDRVWIGANSTIERATVRDTVIGDEAKIDDLVHLGNGSVVGKGAQLTAGCVIAFDVTIGEGVTIAPNAVIRDSVTIAPHTMVGQGAVVVSDIATSGTYVGVPAKRLEK
jgi:UDP-3-O-[3-hydroxymyristoyl] glucosamine N-acyltransferase